MVFDKLKTDAYWEERLKKNAPEILQNVKKAWQSLGHNDTGQTLRGWRVRVVGKTVIVENPSRAARFRKIKFNPQWVLR